MTLSAEEDTRPVLLMKFTCENMTVAFFADDTVAAPYLRTES